MNLPFTLVKRLLINNVSLNITETSHCFLYDFSGASINIKQLKNWFNDKIVDIYEFTGRFGGITKCPWCDETSNEMPKHIIQHNKRYADIETVKLSRKAYQLLLSYVRNNNYDALAFYIHRSCQYCINPSIPGRENKCAIPESGRNKMRSLRELGFKCDGFDVSKYSKNSVCIIYRRRPN